MITTAFCKIDGRGVNGKNISKRLEFSNENKPWVAVSTIAKYLEKSSAEFSTLYSVTVKVKTRGKNEINPKAAAAGSGKAGQAAAKA